MANNFYSYASNGEFSVGCETKSAYLFDAHGRQIAKFKDIKHAYLPMFSPSGEIFILKSVAGEIGVYSPRSRELIKKFYFSDVRGSQDDGCCFSPDGALFYNVERFKKSYLTRICSYETQGWARKAEYFTDAKFKFSLIEHCAGALWVLGWSKDRYFIAKFKGGELECETPINEDEFEYIRALKRLELVGFTDLAKKWSAPKK